MLILVSPCRAAPSSARHLRLTSRVKTRRHRDRREARDQLQVGHGVALSDGMGAPGRDRESIGRGRLGEHHGLGGIGADAGRMCQQAGE